VRRRNAVTHLERWNSFTDLTYHPRTITNGYPIEWFPRTVETSQNAEVAMIKSRCSDFDDYLAGTGPQRVSGYQGQGIEILLGADLVRAHLGAL
jgi:hypothetical protein